MEDRGGELHLIVLIDDATSRIWAHWAEQETTLEHLRALGGWLRRHGRPLALYTDKHSIFRTQHRLEEILSVREGRSVANDYTGPLARTALGNRAGRRASKLGDFKMKIRVRITEERSQKSGFKVKRLPEK